MSDSGVEKPSVSTTKLVSYCCDTPIASPLDMGRFSRIHIGGDRNIFCGQSLRQCVLVSNRRLEESVVTAALAAQRSRVGESLVESMSLTETHGIAESDDDEKPDTGTSTGSSKPVDLIPWAVQYQDAAPRKQGASRSQPLPPPPPRALPNPSTQAAIPAIRAGTGAAKPLAALPSLKLLLSSTPEAASSQDVKMCDRDSKADLKADAITILKPELRSISTLYAVDSGDLSQSRFIRVFRSADIKRGDKRLAFLTRRMWHICSG